MSQGLYLSQKMSLSQVLSPQMQQSLALLQAPTLELKALVEQEMAQNPVLEESAEEPQTADKNEEEGAGEGEAPSPSIDPAEPPADTQFDPATEKPSDAPVDDFQAEFEKLSQMDQEWRDHFAESSAPTRSRQEDEEKRQFMFDSLVAGTSLQEDLLEQMRTSDLPEEKHPVAEMIIGNIDEMGYLKASVEELAASTSLPPEEILEVLRIIQTLHPPGVGARDLRECLMLQLERNNLTDTLEYQIIDQHFDALGKRRIPDLSKGTGADLDDVQEALARIARLNPRPGNDFLPENDIYVMPEVFVTRSPDDHGTWLLTGEDILDVAKVVGALQNPTQPLAQFLWNRFSPEAQQTLRSVEEGSLRQQRRALVVELNKLLPGDSFYEAARSSGVNLSAETEDLSRSYPQGEDLVQFNRLLLQDAYPGWIARRPDYVVSTNNDHLPRLRISNTYKDLMAQADSSPEVRNYIRDKIRAGKFLIKSLHQRQQTILNIGKEIVKRQRKFMDKGVASLKSLTMAQVAEVVGVHETTVSRAVSGKYMQTPQGVFEMKYFFTSGLQTATGENMSNTSVKEMIDSIFKAEDTTKPLSDQEVVQMLKVKGIVIARRTVAKYRSELNILPSSLRKVY